MEEKEIWKDVPGYQGLYQVSNLGRVRSLDRLVQCMNGMRMSKGCIRKNCIGRGGYHIIVLSKDAKTKTFRIHRLVYEAFIGEIPDGYEINHIDEDKNNNALSNLNLMTPKQNANWGTRNERAGIKHRRKVVMDGEIEFDSLTQAADYLGCRIDSIWRCCKNPTHTIYDHHFRYKQKEEYKQ